jgi:RNA polymerase-binding transcription factor DksA
MRREVLSRSGQDRSEDPEAELTRIEAALRRIDEGRYGICDACGAAIGAQVLLVSPDSSLCSSCVRADPRHAT